MSEGRKLIERGDVLDFVFAGKATLTLVSVSSGQRFTYRVSAPKQQSLNPVFFVGLLTGPDNETDYTYMGTIFGMPGHNGAPVFRLTRKSMLTPDSEPVRAFDFVFNRRLFINVPLRASEVEIWHEGRCGRCGRTLTVPESIDRGIGPECAGLLRRAS